MRDSQRQRVYDAENSVGQLFNHKFKDEEACIAFVNEVLENKRVRRKYAKAIDSHTIEIDFKPASWKDCGQADEDTIWINYAWMETKTIIHEIAHTLQFRIQGEADFADHGVTFTSVYLDLVEIMFGAFVADRLQEAFDNHKVEY